MPDYKPNDLPWITPYLIIKEVARAIDFYQNAFGFEHVEEPTMLDDNNQIVHAQMIYNKQAIMLGAEAAWGGTTKTPVQSKVESPITLYVYCEAVDSLFARAQEFGASVIKAPELVFWGDKMCQLKDIDGYLWNFATKVGEFDATLMPEK